MNYRIRTTRFALIPLVIAAFLAIAWCLAAPLAELRAACDKADGRCAPDACPRRSCDACRGGEASPTALLRMREQLELGPRQIERLVEIRQQATDQARNLLTAAQRAKLARVVGDRAASGNAARVAARKEGGICPLCKRRASQQQAKLKLTVISAGKATGEAVVTGAVGQGAKCAKKCCKEKCGKCCKEKCGKCCKEKCDGKCKDKCGAKCKEKCDGACKEKCGKCCKEKCDGKCKDKCGAKCKEKCDQEKSEQSDAQSGDNGES